MNNIFVTNNLQKAGTANAKPTIAQIEQKGREFETLLLQQMVAAMEPKEGLFGQGFGGSFFQSLFREEMAKSLSKDIKLGIAEQLMKAHLRQEAGQSNNPGIPDEKS